MMANRFIKFTRWRGMLKNAWYGLFPSSSNYNSLLFKSTEAPAHRLELSATVHQKQQTSLRVFSTSTAQDINRPADPLPLSSMPGPGGLRKIPYIGTALLFTPFTKYTPEVFGRLINSLHERYGQVFKFRLGKAYSVVTDSVQDVETVFRIEGPYPQRRLMTLSKIFRERNGLPPALGTVSGTAWHELRSPLNPLLNKPQVCLHYLPAQNQVADDFVLQLQSGIADPAALSEIFFKFAAESIGVVCYNHRLGFLDPDLQNTPDRVRLLEAFKTALNCTFMAMIGLEHRYLRTADDPFYRKYEDAMKFIRKQSLQYVEKVVASLEEQSVSHARNNDDNLEVSSVKSGGGGNNLLASMIVNKKLEMQKILAIIDSMLIAGTDSTARNLAVLFYNLARNPQAQEKAAQEVIGLMGHHDPFTPETLSKLHYVKACVRESMRLHFPLSNGTERMLSNDAILSGYYVPKGTSVVMSSSRSSRNPEYFCQPRSFIPERWMRADNPRDLASETRYKKPPAFACLPFGHGPRGCIGRRFAEMEIYVGTAKVLQRLEIGIDPEYPELDPIYTPFITPKQPIPFVFRERKY